MKISYLKHAQVDKVKWDHCIDNASNGMIYGYSIYLDKMAKHWDGLILDDYSAVMPLTWNNKYGIYYLYQPPFSASLGIFGNALNAEIVQAFLQAVPVKFKFWDIYLNAGNVYDSKSFPIYIRHNHLLDLNKSYKTLAAFYSANHTRNIKRAEQMGCTLQTNIAVEDIVKLAKEQSKQFSRLTCKDYTNFISLFHDLRSKGQAITYGVYNDQKKLVASCAYVFSHSRAYYILVGNHPDGRAIGASHFLIDQFIRDHAGKQLILDFEGSQVPTLALFYKGFGSELENYAGLKLNRLPFFAKLFKK